MNEIYYRRTVNNLDIYKSFLEINCKTKSELTKIKEQEKKLSQLKEEIINMLEGIIGEVQEDNIKMKLINFKRDFYNGRGDLQKKVLNLQANITSACYSQLLCYMDSKEEITSKFDELKKTYDHNYLEEKKFITNIILNNIDFMENIRLIDKELFFKIKQLEGIDIESQNGKQRKLDYFLYNFFSRIYLKPSPFATLVETGRHPLNLNDTQNTKIEFLRINVSILLNAFEKYASRKENFIFYKYHLNHTMIKKDGSYFFTIFVNSKNGKLYNNRQSLTTIPQGKEVDELINLFEAKNFYKGEELYEACDSLNINKELLYAMSKARILLRKEHLYESKGETLIECFIRLIRNEDDFSNELKRILRNIEYLEDCVFSWKVADKMRVEIAKLLNHLDFENYKENDYFYIDKLTNELPDGMTEKIFIENESNLNKLSEFASIFDVSFYSKLIAENILKDEYNGEFIPESERELSEFLRKIASTLFVENNYWLESFGYFSSKENNQTNPLIELKSMIFDNLYNALERGEELVVSENQYNHYCTEFKSYCGKTHNSRAYFLQTDNHSILVNHIYKGYGVYSERFRYYFKDHPGDYGLDGNIYDIPMLFGFNANIRENSKCVLKLPIGEDFYKGDDDEINWMSLGFRMAKDRNEIEIFKRSDNSIIYPNFMGTLVTVALPSLVAFFNALVLNDSIYFDFGEVLLRRVLKTFSNNEKITIIPRIYFLNDKIVLSRKKYYVNTYELKQIFVSHKKDIFMQYYKVREWFMGFNLPMEFYLKDIFVSYDQHSELLKEKPEYINIDAILSFKQLRKQIEKKDYILIEEFIPNITDESNVTEFIVETND